MTECAKLDYRQMYGWVIHVWQRAMIDGIFDMWNEQCRYSQYEPNWLLW